MSGVSGPNGDGTLKIAVFDVDRTLLVGTSAEELLARALRRDKMLSLCRVFSGLWQMIKHLHLGWEAAVYYKSYYIRGLKEQEVLARLPAVMDRAVMPRLSPMLLAFIPYLRKAGYQIYIVSGTLNAIVAELVQRLSADGGSGSVLESVKGIYTGMIADIHPYHYGKRLCLIDSSRAEQWIGRRLSPLATAGPMCRCSPALAILWLSIPVYLCVAGPNGAGG